MTSSDGAPQPTSRSETSTAPVANGAPTTHEKPSPSPRSDDAPTVAEQGHGGEEITRPSAATATPPLIVGVDELRSTPWEEDVADIEHVRELSTVFYQRADVALGEAREAEHRVYKALGDAMSFHLHLDDHLERYQPFLRMEGQRSAAMEDLADETYRAFGAVASTVSHLLVRARIADLAWERVRDHRAAMIAIDALLAWISRRDAAAWPDVLRKLERAFQIAAQLGRNAKQREQVENAAHALLVSAPYEDGFRTLKVAQLLLKYAKPDFEALGQLAEGICSAYANAAEWHLAQGYAELAIQCAMERHDDTARRSAQRRAADLYVQEAECILGDPSGSRMLAGHKLTTAVELLRRARATDDAKRVYRRLRTVQRQGLRELRPISHEIDLTAPVQRAEAYFERQSRAHALLAFVRLGVIPEREALRTQAVQHAGAFPLSHLMPRHTLDADGKVIDRRGSALSADDSEREGALRAEMISQLILHITIQAMAQIRPALHTIARVHDVRMIHCVEFVKANPVIGEDREWLVAEGIFAGFSFDLPKALHIVIPQLEHALRVLLEHAGVDTSKMDAEHRQEDRNLNWLLYRPELTGILGEDMVFTMQALLVEKVGPNLRNRMAHGLLSYADCFSAAALAAWWVIVRFFSIPLLYAAVHDKFVSNDDTEDAAMDAARREGT